MLFRSARAEATAFFEKNPSGAIARNPDDMICGSPETVLRVMRAYADAGIGLLICGLLIDVENRAPLRRSLTLLQQEVMPKITGQAAPRLANAA